MNSDEIKTVLKSARSAQVPCFVWGDSGIGKSECVKQFTQENGLGFVDLRIGTQEAGDLIGLPSKEGDRTVWLKPAWFPELNTKGIIFLDELNQFAQ